MGEDSAARAAYDAVLSREPTNAAALFGRAPVLARLGDRKAAIADYSRGLALAAFPQPGHFLERASLQAAEYGTDEAIKGLEEGLARLGWMVTLQKTAIDLELERQRTDEALARLETIITRSNRKETWLAWKGEILLAAGKTQQAQDVLSAALKAIDGLPPRMRTSSGMTELRAKVEGLLGSASAGSSVDTEQVGERKLANKEVD
jgi:tetratricopeptide (TPR) repeat protein